MKSGRPTTWIPSESTVARGVERLWNKTRQRLRDRLEVLAHIATDFGMENRITAVTCDNATDNDAMVKTLSSSPLAARKTGSASSPTSSTSLPKWFLRLFDHKPQTEDEGNDGEGGDADLENLPDLEELMQEMRDLQPTDDGEDDSGDDIFDEDPPSLLPTHLAARKTRSAVSPNLPQSERNTEEVRQERISLIHRPYLTKDGHVPIGSCKGEATARR
ncbi:hypothetical protein GGX14DRAFT_701276 [Mycena pura]|uniref:Uncharacterized protein n=1 Tax=Mycena pura TaxID=153505 RepID=A0AAD6URS2_9AGAR|nr:hypothetical protein GGX14DRAFT_701276 [Mycena pura]